MYARIKDSVDPETTGYLKHGVVYETHKDDAGDWVIDSGDWVIDSGEGGEHTFYEYELDLSEDKFQPGDVVDWVYEDGGQRANGYWDGSTIVERCTTIAYEDHYKVRREDGSVGVIHGDDLVLSRQEKPATRTTLGMNKSFSMTFYPTGEKMGEGIDVSEYISDLTGFTMHPYQEDVEDVITEPSHYKEGMPEGTEVRDIIKAQGFWKEFCAGNVIKYSLRWQYKNGTEDLKKMLQYGQWLVEELEDEDA